MFSLNDVSPPCQHLMPLTRLQTMPKSECRLIKNSMEFLPADEISFGPRGTRGIYVLYAYRRRINSYNVVYVGMARGERSGIPGRLRAHRRHPERGGSWTHFSVFEVWDNISEQEVEELEGLFRHLYRKDSVANRLNLQRSYRPLNQVRKRCEWEDGWL